MQDFQRRGSNLVKQVAFLLYPMELLAEGGVFSPPEPPSLVTGLQSYHYNYHHHQGRYYVKCRSAIIGLPLISER